MDSNFENEELRNEIKREINSKGFETLKKEKIDKLVQLFKEMLEYKNKKYDINWDFKKWIEEMDLSYHYYHYILQDTLYQVEYRTLPLMEEEYEAEPIEIDDTQIIIALTELYSTLTLEDNNYKKYANCYEEIVLNKGETYLDLYNKKIDEFTSLFKEMLEFLNVKHEKDDFDSLSSLICKHFPYYMQIIINLKTLLGDLNQTYISILYSMQKIYEHISKNYKKHEQNMKKYKKEQEDSEALNDDLISEE